MSILLYVSIAWVTLCVLFVELDLIFLLIVEHASDTSQATAADESISDQAPHMALLDLAMDENVRPACFRSDRDSLELTFSSSSLAISLMESFFARRPKVSSIS